MISEPSTSHDEIQRLPDDLRERILAELRPEHVRICAGCDLGARGQYVDGYLVLTRSHLGHFVHSNGTWDERWHDMAHLTHAHLVEGLGLNMLRLISDGEAVAEYRCTLRHAKSLARIHRQMERDLTGEELHEQFAEEGEEEKSVRCEKCGHVIPAWSERCPRCTSRRRILSRLLDYVKPYKGQAAAGLALAIVVTLSQLFIPYITRPLINQGLGKAEGAEANYGLVVLYVGLMAVAFFGAAVGRMFQTRVIYRLGSNISRDLRGHIYGHLHSLSLSFFAKKQTGSLVSRVTHDTERVWRFIAFGLVDSITAMLMLVGVGVFMFITNARLAAWVLLPIPVMLGLMVYFHKKLHRVFRRLWHRFAQMTAVIGDALPGVRVIKAFGQEDREIGRFEDRSGAVYDEEMTFITTWSLFAPVMMFTSQLGLLIIWLLGGWWVVTGQMEIGTLVPFLLYVGMFMRPIHMIAHLDQMLNRAATSAQRLFEILDTEPVIYSRHGAHRPERLEGRIELRNVSFSYDGIRKVLKNVSLTIEPGQMVGLAGPSGGGKTTMTNLICRFYDVLEGQILIDGKDVREYDVYELRQQVGVVLQEPFLFHGTVAENVAYGNPGATIDEIITAARAANAHDFIVGFPDGYDTMVGERGQSLSGGERQRISIARAILNDPAILILDEATSSVDTETEKLIQEALAHLTRSRTTIAIAHRLSTLRRADKLLVLDSGELIEEGTHDELATKPDGTYARLLRMQSELHSVMAIG
ncbi:MAG: ABC transporter ATP-binding protein [Planctomycetota bacterium]